ncbi:hypothetical protein [Herbidospora sp. NBRC 101105]|uniref:hypothetical protein n=1 Tax=Herbidospora sp. NBRC 101105 TaxID=3032195 RepID=UPI0024A0DA57|nr:hypothetical protein [Herbidospora sp. NBRC 101105]GLX95004.1 hypothetical protein Hesp01_29540 [Herbidospora sp. NBRC 101105]
MCTGTGCRYAHQAAQSAGSASRSVGSASTLDGPQTAVHASEASHAPVAVVLTSVNPTPVTAMETFARPTTRSSSAGKRTSPATSLSFPVTNPGQAAFSTWSLTTRTTMASTVRGWPIQVCRTT